MEFGKSNVLVVLILGEMMYGFVGLFSRYFYDLGLQSVDITFLRMIVIVAVLLVALLIFRRDLLKVKPKDVLFFVIFGLFNLGNDVMFIFSTDHIPLALASVLQMMFPFYIIVLSLFLFKEKVDGKKILAVLVGFVGCTLITGNMFAADDLGSLGIVAALMSGLCLAIYILGGTFSYKRGYHPATYLLFTALLSDLIALPFINHGLVADTLFTPDFVPFLLGLGVVASLIPMFVEVWSAGYLSPTVISIVSMVEVVSAAAIGAVLFDEILDLLDIFGIALVLFSIAIINIRIGIRVKRYFQAHPEAYEKLREEYGPRESEGQVRKEPR